MSPLDQLSKYGFVTADKVSPPTLLSTGTKALDNLLGGGLEVGLTHLFYGSRSLHNDLLRLAVHAQLPKSKGGLATPTVIIDSANAFKIERITDYAFEFGLEPEDVMDRIYVSRAFNASQTYSLVMEQLEGFFHRVAARLLIVAGLPDLYISESVTADGNQQISHMASRLKTFTMNREIVTVVTAPASQKNPDHPMGGRTLASAAQVHIKVEESKSYFRYTLTKHPLYTVRQVLRTKQSDFGTTLPLSHFIDGLE
ncbi:MAG: hypothetical protein HXY34_01215 [Candidatus Thorarchaeota archaeon]|nr:hypothetical protein [Candidatus Thorarchaeota archaeon]